MEGGAGSMVTASEDNSSVQPHRIYLFMPVFSPPKYPLLSAPLETASWMEISRSRLWASFCIVPMPVIPADAGDTASGLRVDCRVYEAQWFCFCCELYPLKSTFAVFLAEKSHEDAWRLLLSCIMHLSAAAIEAITSI
jgi:hypothetical protein